MVSRVGYNLQVPSHIVFTPPNLKGINLTLKKSDSASPIDSIRVSNFCNFCVCDVITDIWCRFKDWISTIFVSIYRFITCGAERSYPEINTNLSTTQLNKLYWGLGKDNKWRECIDGRYHHLNDKYCFDKGTHGGTIEPGFIQSMEETFEHVGNFLNKKIDADWYLGLHKHTAAHFKGAVNGTLMGQEKVGVFRDSDDSVQAGFSNEYVFTPEGKAELVALDASVKAEFGSLAGIIGDFVPIGGNSAILKYKIMPSYLVRNIFNKFLNEYYREIDTAATADQKLYAIARLHQRLEWLHPVRDGTARTSTALMNKNLVECGFHPAILEFPHVSSSYGLEQWKQYLQTGLVKWENARASLNPASTC